MNSSSQQSSSNRAGHDESGRAAAQRRDVTLGVVVAMLLFAGVVLGGAQAPGQEPLLAQPVASAAAEPPAQFEYFPAKYVNRGVESSTEIPTF